MDLSREPISEAIKKKIDIFDQVKVLNLHITNKQTLVLFPTWKSKFIGDNPLCR